MTSLLLALACILLSIGHIQTSRRLRRLEIQSRRIRRS